MARTSVDCRVAIPSGGMTRWRTSGWLAGHQAVEQLGRLVADQLGVGDDAGEGRVAELADLLLVVDADDGDLLGDGQVHPVAGVEDVLAPDVVAGHDPDRLGQARSASRRSAPARSPRGGRPCRTRGTRRPGRSRPAARRSRRTPPAGAATTTRGRTRRSANRRKPRSRRWSAPSSAIARSSDQTWGRPRVPWRSVRSIRGTLVRGGGLGQLPGRGPGDDPVAVPVLQPLRGPAGQRPLLQEDRPGLMRVDVAADPPEDPPAVGAGGLDDQGHSPTPRHLDLARSIRRPARRSTAARRDRSTARGTPRLDSIIKQE